MRITKHVALHKVADAPLWNYVREHNIKVDADADSDIVSFDIFTCDEHWPWIEKYNIQHQVVFTSDLEFSKEELQAAPWMVVRSVWRTGCPQPSDGYAYMNITYTDEDILKSIAENIFATSPAHDIVACLSSICLGKIIIFPCSCNNLTLKIILQSSLKTYLYII